VLLSGRATSQQERFMKLDKRYTTAIDLHGRTTTGDPEGELIDEREPPSGDELDAALDRLRGTVELPVPAASAVKIDGERAYRLHRRGTVVEMPVRAMHVHELTLRSYESGVAQLELLVGSGTYIRSIADALGGHCVELRRTDIGPFRVGEADPERVIPLEDALARLVTAPAREPTANGGA
jgi:tRNA pseudouridine55 synthase